MTKAEIMNCAATLAAGIIANERGQTNYDSAAAVELVEDIAEKLRKMTADEDREYRRI